LVFIYWIGGLCSMVVLSEAGRMVMRIAVLEAFDKNFDQIHAEYILLGICSIDKLVSNGYADFNSRKEIGQINPPELLAFHGENDDIKDIFNFFSLDPISVRKHLRSHIESNYHSSPYSPLELETPIGDFRWENNKYYNHAQTLALNSGHEEVTALHLLVTLMDLPTPGIRMVLDRNLQEVANDTNLKLNRYRKDQPLISLESTETPYLAQIGTNLTNLASQGKIEPLIGREDELLQLVRTLMRKKKNNPLLLGEAGVGKTALVRALAQKIADRNVPQNLMNKRIYQIDMQSVVSGTKYRGEMEQKMQFILKEAKNPNVILFLDEFHTVMGAGLSEGTILDVSNMMKPALESGDMTCIGATTLVEYRRYVERDQAFARRFHQVMVEEPSENDTMEILKGLRNNYQDHHHVQISDEAIEFAVKLSVRYLHQKKLPDKALDLLEDACLAQTVQKDDYYSMHYKIAEVTGKNIIEAVERKVGIPIKLEVEERRSILMLDDELKKRVIGQDEAIRSLSRRLKIARSGLNDPHRPYGVFLFMGSTGVGKTYLAKNLAKNLFGKEEDLIRLDMSEYMDPGSLSKLIGAPPGYIGSEEGKLTGALRTKPYSVVLLDEMEKAHPSIFDLFLQVFDEGRFTDGKGVVIDARNTIFIMTSNLPLQSQDCGTSYGAPSSQKSAKEKARENLLQSLRPEFVNRIDEVIIFNPLDAKGMKKIARNMLDDFKSQLMEKGIRIEVDEGVVDHLARVGYDRNFGARPLRRAMEDELKYPLSEMLIGDKVSKGDDLRVKLEDNMIAIEKTRYNTVNAGYEFI
jgi:ATP-dependent Clp protease ATP-binding subunit ClpC